jgi:hypothetical protein
MEIDQMAAIDNATSEELELMLNLPTEANADAENAEVPATTEAPVPDQPDTANVQAEPTPAKLAELEERMAKYEKQLKDKEDFINQRNQEIGLLRKQLLEKKAEALAEDAEPNEEEILRDPKAAIKKAIERAKDRELLQKQQDMEAHQEAVEQTRQVLQRLVPTFEESKPIILELMKVDKADAHLIEQFDRDPTTIHPALVYQLQKRAELYKELQALKEKTSAEPKKLADNLSKFGNAKSPTSQAPVSNPKSKRLDSLTEADIDRMSLDELNALQREL